MSSNIWITLSDCPSLYGWNAVLNAIFVPMALCKLFQNVDVNLGSLSDTIETSSPCNLTISLIYYWAYWSILYVDFTGRKWVDLVNLSTITHMKLYPFCVLGNPSTKSIVMCSHFHSGINKGFNNPDGLWCSILTCWQVRHSATNFAISLFILGHK